MIQIDFLNSRKDSSKLQQLLSSLSKKEKKFGLIETEEYLDECFVAYAEAMVIRLAQNQNITIDENEMKEYFFEELVDRNSEFDPMDLKLMSVNYTEKSRNQLRQKMLEHIGS